jgi:hypothetical protein
MGWVGHTLEWRALAGAPVQAASVNVRVCVTARLFFDPVPMAKTAKPSAGPRANGHRHWACGCG